MKAPFSILTISILLLSSSVYSQSNKAASSTPLLVVGIVVDQMRNDYIYRYWSRFGEGGFKRLVNEGYYFKNSHYNYIPTYTGPGHCSIYTGTTPRSHGIIGNDWVLKNNFAATYCVEDSLVLSVGASDKAGQMSPKRQLSTTIGDELIMSSNHRSKVFALALKDRSAVLPAGHVANGAFWFDDASGNFISSSWYCKELPVWVKEFNTKQFAKSYLEKGWNTLYPVASYTNSPADDNVYEGTPFKDKPVFPYEFSSFLSKNNFGIIKVTPYGNSLTKDLALSCIKNEHLGKDEFTDLLCISFSSTDYVGHTFGPRAVEMEDVYLRLDKDLEELLNYLDAEVGKHKYTVFLTADHGAADVPRQLTDNKIPAGRSSESTLSQRIKSYFNVTYGDTSLLAKVSNEQIYLNENKVSQLKLDLTQVEEKLSMFMVSITGVAEAYSSATMKYRSFEKNDYRALLQNGYNHKLSGNVCFMFEPGWMDHGEKGTTHGSGYNYDTHVPLLFYGFGIKKGESTHYTTITQIAPSICELLHLNQPSACTSEPLNSFFK
ncbi:MAG: alkaline phosphatase family protein [bacterium]|nr:alkaline phosphatase family protein [bacterium]